MEGLNIVITEEGLRKIARATIEEPLIIDRFGVGDGNGEEVELEASRTSLVNEKYRDYVNNKYTNDNNIVVECVLRGNAPIEEGFYLREIGLFDVDGDLIAHAKLPEQYRPPYEEGQIVTESIFNIDLRIENSESIQVNIQETIFATVDDLQRLREEVENLKNTNIALMKSKVGVDTWFNTNNTHKGIRLLTIGIQTWGLMEEGNILNIADYQDAFKNCGAVDKGDGTFQIPIMHSDTTIKNISSNNERELGSYEADELKSHEHTMDHDHSMKHDHDMSHQHNAVGSYDGHGNSNNLAFNAKGSRDINSVTIGGRDRTGGSSIEKTGVSSISNTGSIGGSETRMKNTSGQWYMLLNIIY